MVNARQMDVFRFEEAGSGLGGGSGGSGGGGGGGGGGGAVEVAGRWEFSPEYICVEGTVGLCADEMGSKKREESGALRDRFGVKACEAVMKSCRKGNNIDCGGFKSLILRDGEGVEARPVSASAGVSFEADGEGSGQQSAAAGENGCERNSSTGEWTMTAFVVVTFVIVFEVVCRGWPVS